MQWLDAIRDFFMTSDLEERTCFSEPLATAQMLEYRLVLGSLSSDLLGSQTSSATAATTSSSSAQSTDVSSNSALSQVTPTSILQPDSSGSLSSDGSPSTTDPSSSTLQTTSAQSSTSLASDTASSSTALNSTVLPDNGNTATPSTVTSSSTPSVTAPNTTATQNSTPTASTTATSSSTTGSSATSSPPAAIDKALTAINPNVLVTSAELAAAQNGSPAALVIPAWFNGQSTTIYYDFRDINGSPNTITSQEIQATQQVLQAWSTASGGTIQFVQDTQSNAQDIINIGVGDLSAVGLDSTQGGVLGASNHALVTTGGVQTSVGTIWLNSSETFTTSSGINNPTGSVDFATVMAHEVGNILGLNDDPTTSGIMSPTYSGQQDLSGITTAYQHPTYYSSTSEDANGYISDTFVSGQLASSDVEQLLKRATVATPTQDAIIAIVDRNGNILGVHTESGVTITDPATLAFAIDGAVSVARTAALFANDTAPITSRTIEALSQTTILQREVEANPNSTDPTTQGPGFVAPVGIGGNFPAGINNTPPVDLFGIEGTNRGSGRTPTNPTPTTEAFNIDLSNVPTGAQLNAMVSYGTASGDPAMASDVQNRGIGTLPGGLPIYLNGTLVGGIGVFFPGSDGYATHEQGFVQGQTQTVAQRMDTNQELEAEFIAYAALGGSPMATTAGVFNAVVGTIGGIAPVAGVSLPFGSITLNGITLPLFGSSPGIQGLQDLINQFQGVLGTGTLNGTDEPLLGTAPGATTLGGSTVPFEYLVNPHTAADSSLTTADMNEIIDAGIAAANQVRAQIRIGAGGNTGAAGVRMTFAITDPAGNVLALYRMDDGTIFSTDVAIAKARNVSYYDNPSSQLGQDQVATTPGGPDIAAGTAFESRTFRYLAEPLLPAGINGSQPGQFSILNDAKAAGINPTTGENIGAAAPASAFTSVMGYDAFNPGTNFNQQKNDNQNGIVFFPGSMPLYKNGKLVGGLGVSGDGVNQDDVVTYLAAQGFMPNGTTTPTADETTVNGTRLPFVNFDRNPFA